MWEKMTKERNREGEIIKNRNFQAPEIEGVDDL